MSDNGIFYLMGDNTLGGDNDEEAFDVWILLVDGQYWHTVWSQKESDAFISINNKPGAPVKLMYQGKVNPVV